jgi:hypothetical protein
LVSPARISGSVETSVKWHGEVLGARRRTRRCASLREFPVNGAERDRENQQRENETRGTAVTRCR